MINIKTAASIVAAVSVAGVTVQQIITRTRKDAVEIDVETPLPADAFTIDSDAFDLAQAVISDRFMTGYYDHTTDAQVRAEFEILYQNYAMN